jgi:hypothetical protein
MGYPVAFNITCRLLLAFPFMRLEQGGRFIKIMMRLAVQAFML